MEKRKQYIEETAEKETVKLFNNSLLHPEFKYGFILGMTHADKVPFIKNHKVYDTISKEFIDKACKWLEEKNKLCMYELEMILGGNFINDFKKAMEDE